MNRRILIVMRHAKAEPFAATDHARRLTGRGRSEAEASGRHLADRDLSPECALVSTALRAVETWQTVVAGLGQRKAPTAVQETFDDVLYSGGPEDVLQRLRSLPDEQSPAIVIGHNPTVAHLVHLLDGDGDPAATNAILRGYPTSALTVLEVDRPWVDLRAETARIVDFHSP